ncbi:MAG: metallophosphoesterase [Deltaproteobacteria bacterium]|nr:metallophosphoesterase [Deltaproteobacteria bacterium]
MKIGVISDTHLKGCDERLRRLLERLFRDVDWVLHAGDLVDLSVLELFGQKEAHAVYGNCDPPEVRQALSERRVLEAKGFRLGLVHDPESLCRMERGGLEPMGPLDCLVFGHTHRPVNVRKDGVLYFNPGSATDNRFSRHNSVGILHIGKGVRGEIIELRDH